MKVSEMGKVLFDEIAASLQESGFKSRWSRRDFRRREDWGVTGLHLFYYTYSACFKVAGELIVSIDEVQELVAPFDADMESKVAKELPTLSRDIGQHLHYNWSGVEVLNLQDIPGTVAEMKRIVCEVLLPFAEKYHRVEHAYDLLRSEGGDAYSSLVYLRGMKLLAMAKILDRNDDLAQIAEEYRARIVRAKESNKLPQFEALLASLS